MFGRRFDLEKAGAPRAPFFSARLFGKHVTGACDWSRAHTLTDMPGADRTKFSLEPHPLESEGRKRKLEPTPEFKAREVAEKRKALLAAADNNTIKEELKKAMAREQIEAIPDHVEQDFIHDFHNWVAGIGKRSDYVKAGVPLASVGQGKLVSDHPSVLNYVEGITSRVIDYYAEIANMKMRGPAIGRRGGPATLNDLWLYFKYVVRNEPVDPNDFAPQPGPSEPDAALVGNQEGITDEPDDAPSLKIDTRKRSATEEALRAKPADSQVRKKADPKEVRKEAEEDAVMDLGAPEPEPPKKADGGAVPKGGPRRHEEPKKAPRRDGPELRPRPSGGKKTRAASPPKPVSAPAPAPVVVVSAPSPPPHRPEPDFTFAAELVRKHGPVATAAASPPPPPSDTAPPAMEVSEPPKPVVETPPPPKPAAPKEGPTLVAETPRVPEKPAARRTKITVPDDLDEDERVGAPIATPAPPAPLTAHRPTATDVIKEIAGLTADEREALRAETGRSPYIAASDDPVKMARRIEELKKARVRVEAAPAAPMKPPEAAPAAAPPAPEPTKVPPTPIAAADDHHAERDLARTYAFYGKPDAPIAEPILARYYGTELGRGGLPLPPMEHFADAAAYRAAVQDYDEARRLAGLPARSVVGPLLAGAASRVASWLPSFSGGGGDDAAPTGVPSERLARRIEESRKIAGSAGGSGGFSLPSISLPSLPALPSISLPGLPSVSLPSVPMDKVKALFEALTPAEAPEGWEKAYEFRVPIAPPTEPAAAPPAALAPTPVPTPVRAPRAPKEEWDAQWLRNIRQAEHARRLAAMQAAEERRRAAMAPEPTPRELRPEAPLPARAPAPGPEMGRVPYDLRPGLDARLQPIQRLTNFVGDAAVREAEEIAFEDVPDHSKMARFLERLVPRVHDALRAEYAGITAQQVAQAVRLATYSLRAAPHVRESFPERILKAIEASVL